MELYTRRRLLGVLGAGAAGLAGCGGGGTTEGYVGSPTRGDATATPGRPADGSPSAGGSPSADGVSTGGSAERLELSVVDEPLAADAPLTVYPAALRGWLRRAGGGETVRGHDEAPVYAPEPLLPAFEHVRLELDDESLAGTYAVTADGGPRYRLLVGAERADPPAGAAVTAVSDLPADRRSLAEAAVTGEGDDRVYPETPLGEWTRESFFGGYYAYEGTTYRGREVRQTDAAFFSEAVWYVLELEPAEDAADPVALQLAEIPPAVRAVVDPLLETWEKDDPGVATGVRDLPDEVVDFAVETELLLTHTAAFRVAVSSA